MVHLIVLFGPNPFLYVFIETEVWQIIFDKIHVTNIFFVKSGVRLTLHFVAVFASIFLCPDP